LRDSKHRRREDDSNASQQGSDEDSAEHDPGPRYRKARTDVQRFPVNFS
jgi:hypothetical protein